MKKLLILMMSFAMVLSMSACGSKGNEADVQDSETVVEDKHDVLAGTCYKLTAFENDFGNGWEKGEIDTEHPYIFTFGTDGTYEEQTWEPDWENNDFDTLIEKKYTGTYTVDGSDITFTVDKTNAIESDNDSEDNSEQIEMTDEEKEALKQTITLEGDTIVIQTDYAKLSDGSEISGVKRIYTKTE